MLEPIAIPRLARLPGRTTHLVFETHLPEVATLVPVQGEMILTHEGSYLRVQGRAKSIVTLVCGRCLEHFNQRLEVDTTELIGLDAAAANPNTRPAEQELSPDQLVEVLSPDGTFDPQQWLHDHVCLAWPLVVRCSPNCPGIPAAIEGELPDPRWAALTSTWLAPVDQNHELQH